MAGEAERLGASFTIDISSLKAGLKTANQLIRESKSEFEAAASGLDKFSDAQAIAEAKVKHLTTTQELQQKKVEALKKEYKRLVDEGMDEASDAASRLRTQINKEEKSLNDTEAELKEQKKALDDMASSSKKAGDETKTAGEKAEKAANGGFTVLKGALANLVAEGFRKATDAAKDFLASVVEVGKTFDSSMSQVSAVSGATGSELELLREKAQEMGETTKFTASEAADAFNYMAMAGWKTEDMLDGIDGILNLAAASGTDLATTSDIVTDALTAMGYSAKDSGRLADVMAAASSNANTNVEMMGATFQYAAPLVGALGYTMEDTAVAIGLMANAGIKGEKAGTALRSVFTRLAAPPKDAAEAMDQLGISLTDSAGKMKPFNEVIEDLRKGFAGLDETQQTQTASALAGQEAMSGLLAIVNASPSDFAKLTKAVKQSEGAAQSMADTMIDNLGGDMTILQSQLDGVRLTIYKEFEPTLRSAIKSIQKQLSSVDWKSFSKKAKDALKTVIDRCKELSKTVLPALKTIVKGTAQGIGFLIDNFKLLAPVVLTAVTVFKTFQAVMAVKSLITATTTAVAGLSAGVGFATKAQTLWNAAMSANPIGAVLTAVGLLTAGIVLLTSSQNEAAESTYYFTERQQELIDKNTKAQESFNELKRSAEETTGAQIANVDYVKNNLLPQLQNIVDSNGQVKAGEEARAQYILGELNSALGTEYQSLSDIVGANGQIKDSIYDIIEAKKAEMLLSGYEEVYKAAIQSVSDAEAERAARAQELAIQTAEVEKAHLDAIEAARDYSEAKEEGRGGRRLQLLEGQMIGYSSVWKHEKDILAEKEAAYNASDAVVKGYYDAISSYENASTAVLSGNAAQAIEILGQYGSGFTTAASLVGKSKDEQLEILKQQVIDTETNLGIMVADYDKNSKSMTDAEKKEALERIKSAKKQAQNAKEEYYSVGGNMIEGMVRGVTSNEWQLTDAMKKAVDDAVAAAKAAADIQSPSKRFRKEVGVMMGLGTALGVKDSTKKVVKSVRDQVEAIANTYGNLDAQTISANINGTAKSKSSSPSGGGGVTVYQTNNYSQAHSRYEIYKSKQQTAAAVRLAIQGV